MDNASVFFFFFLLVPWLRDTYTRSQAPLPGATSAYRLDVRGQAVVSSPFDFGNCTCLQIHPRFPDDCHARLFLLVKDERCLFIFEEISSEPQYTEGNRAQR